MCLIYNVYGEEDVMLSAYIAIWQQFLEK